MKKGKKKYQTKDQLAIDFDKTPSASSEKDQKVADIIHESKVIHLDSRSHLYRSILNRKME